MSLSGKQLYTRETNPTFRNKSQLPLPLGEEIVHPPKKLDLLSFSIKGKQMTPKKVRIPNLKKKQSLLTQDLPEKANFAIGGATDHPRRLRVCFAGCYQIAVNW